MHKFQVCLWFSLTWSIYTLTDIVVYYTVTGFWIYKTNWLKQCMYLCAYSSYLTEVTTHKHCGHDSIGTIQCLRMEGGCVHIFRATFLKRTSFLCLNHVTIKYFAFVTTWIPRNCLFCYIFMGKERGNWQVTKSSSNKGPILVYGVFILGCSFNMFVHYISLMSLVVGK